MSLMPILPTSKATKFRLDKATADGVTLDLTSGTALSDTNSIRWKPDGTRLFCAESNSANGSYIYYWDCSTAWDLSTASYVARIALNQEDGTTIENGQPYDSLDFNADGTQVTIVFDFIFRTWSLSGVYSGTTARLATEILDDGISMSFVNSGASLLYLRNGQIYSRAMTTAYDITTIGAESTEHDLTTASSIAPARSGTRLLSVDSNVANEYKTAGSFDYSALTLNESFNPSANVQFGVYAGNGTKLYLLNNEVLTQYSVTG